MFDIYAIADSLDAILSGCVKHSPDSVEVTGTHEVTVTLASCPCIYDAANVVRDLIEKMRMPATMTEPGMFAFKVTWSRDLTPVSSVG